MRTVGIVPEKKPEKKSGSEAKLKKEVKDLKAENSRLKKEIKDLTAENLALRKDLDEIQNENELLRASGEAPEQEPGKE